MKDWTDSIGECTPENPLIDKIQAARGGDRELFPSVLNDVMVDLGWTEQQAAENLDTTVTTIGRWMSGANIPTSSVREAAYERMICALVEQDCLQGMTIAWGRGVSRDFVRWALPLTVGGIALMFVLTAYFG